MTATHGKCSTGRTAVGKINSNSRFTRFPKVAYGKVASIRAGTTSGTIYVSTGLRSPVYGQGILLTDVSVISTNKAASKTLKYLRASGSYAVFRIDKPATVKAGASYCAFNWLAFEE